MCSFNKINGEYSCENPFTLRNVLKETARVHRFRDDRLRRPPRHLLTGSPSRHRHGDRHQTALRRRPAVRRREPQCSAAVAGEPGGAAASCTTMFRLGIFDHSIPRRPRSPCPSARQGRAADRGAGDHAAEERAPQLPLTAAPRRSPSSARTRTSSPRRRRTLGQGRRRAPPLLGNPRAAQRRRIRPLAAGNDPVNAASMLETTDMTTVPSSVLAPPNGVGTGLKPSYWTTRRSRARRASPDRQAGQLRRRVPQHVRILRDPRRSPSRPSLPRPSSPSCTTATSPPRRPVRYTLDLTGFGDATLSMDGQQIITMNGADGPSNACVTPSCTWSPAWTHTLHITYQADHPFDSLEPRHPAPSVEDAGGCLVPGDSAGRRGGTAERCGHRVRRTNEGESRDRVSLNLPAERRPADRGRRARPTRTRRRARHLRPGHHAVAEYVDAVVQTYFGGQEQGGALARVLWGDVEPPRKAHDHLPGQRDRGAGWCHEPHGRPQTT